MKHITFQTENGIGVVTINRPEALNALNGEVLKELEQLFIHEVYNRKIRGVIITGAGEKAFIAGADIKAMNEMSQEEIQQFIALGQWVTRLIEEAPAIVIAAVNGYALGGGLEIALACDMIFASENARLGLPEVTLGLIPGFGGTQRLTRAVGERRAKQLIFSGVPVSAAEARQMGLVNEVFKQEELLVRVREVLQKMLSNSFFAVLQAKEAVQKGSTMSLESGLALEKHAFQTAFSHPDRIEGIRAFLEKRKPQFS